MPTCFCLVSLVNWLQVDAAHMTLLSFFLRKGISPDVFQGFREVLATAFPTFQVMENYCMSRTKARYLAEHALGPILDDEWREDLGTRPFSIFHFA